MPIHPLDEKGKTPRNLEHGVFSPVLTKGMSERITGGEIGQKWDTLKSAPREALTGSLASTTRPTRVSRTIAEGGSSGRFVSHGNDSSIGYDPRERRFVNNNNSSATSTVKAGESRSESGQTDAASGTRTGNVLSRTPNPAGASSPRAPSVPSATRTATPPPAARSASSPPAPRYSGGERGGSSGSSGSSRGSGGSSGSSGSSSGRSSSGSSSGSSSRPSGGRPH